MKVKPSQRWSRRVYRIMRGLVRLIAVFSILLVFTFVFLRLYGVPDPILREVVRRANEAGIAIDVERVTLGLHGWRAENVRYYSSNPDDLNPVVRAGEVLVARFFGVEGDPAQRWSLNVEAADVCLNPSVDWKIHVPEGSKCRTIESVKLSVAFAPDRIEFSNGAMTWLGADFRVEGVYLRPRQQIAAAKGEPLATGKTLSLGISEAQFAAWENRLKQLRIHGDAVVDISFSVDADHLAGSRVDFQVLAEDISYRNVDFSRFECGGDYAYPIY